MAYRRTDRTRKEQMRDCFLAHMDAQFWFLIFGDGTARANLLFSLPASRAAWHGRSATRSALGSMSLARNANRSVDRNLQTIMMRRMS